MILLTTEQIKKIAEELDCGFTCFINKNTREQVFLYGEEDSFFSAGEDAWADERKKIQKNARDYLKIEKMESRESFSLRRDFADTVDSASLKNELFNALSQRKPFSKFKYIIDGSGDYREKWFTFKDERMQEWVKEQIDIYNRSLINDDNEEDDD